MYRRIVFILVAVAFCVAVVLSDSRSDSRIVGGQDAVSWQCAHAVAIRLTGGVFHCNGVLISPQDVLTAAQCVYNGDQMRSPSEFQVTLGSMENSVSTSMVRSVLAVWTNGYTPATRVPDVAILRLNANVSTSGSLTLHIAELGTSTPAVDRPCQFCGFGASSMNGSPSQTMQVIQLTVQSSASPHCVQTAQGALQPDMLCAGVLEAGRGACTWDVGAPLVCDSVLSGVLSMPGGCGALNEVSIFANTALQYAWIVNRTQTIPDDGAQIVIHFGLIAVGALLALSIK